MPAEAQTFKEEGCTNSLYFVEAAYNRVRYLDASAVAYFYAGSTSGLAGYADQVGTSGPRGICALPSTNTMLIPDTLNHCIRRIDMSTLSVSSMAGGCGNSGDVSTGSVGTDFRFSNPTGCAFDTSGNIYIADAGNCKIKRLNSGFSSMTSYGSGDCGSGDVSDRVGQPNTLFVSNGFLYFPVYTYIKRMQLSSGIISIYAGSSTTAALNDGTLTGQATFGNVNSLWIDSSGNMYISDRGTTGGGRIRYIPNAGTTVSTIGGTETGTSDTTSLTATSLADAYIDTPMGVFGNTASPTTSFAVFYSEFGTGIIRRMNQGGIFPTRNPTLAPSPVPSISMNPTQEPSWSLSPTVTPMPSPLPTELPSASPTVAPSVLPTVIPSVVPTVVPSALPTVEPTVLPSIHPSLCPTVLPSILPTELPTMLPTVAPTIVPSASPSLLPTAIPTVMPTATPTVVPTDAPSCLPTISPTTVPTVVPSVLPTPVPSKTPSNDPTQLPTIIPTNTPSLVPTSPPTILPTVSPTIVPTAQPTVSPTAPSFAIFAPPLRDTNTSSGSQNNASAAVNVLTSLTSSQGEISVITETVRVVSQSLPPVVAGSSTAIDLPLTDDEKALQASGKLVVPSISLTAGNSTGSNSTFVAVALLDASLWTRQNQSTTPSSKPQP
eukprot:gene27560-33286_t